MLHASYLTQQSSRLCGTEVGSGCSTERGVADHGWLRILLHVIGALPVPLSTHIVAAAVQKPEQDHSVELEEHVFLHCIQNPLVLQSRLALQKPI